MKKAMKTSSISVWRLHGFSLFVYKLTENLNVGKPKQSQILFG